MNASDVFRHYSNQAHFVTRKYLADMSEADLLVRPVPGANHIKWQLGHLITSEQRWMTALAATMPPLPPGFEAAHAKAATNVDDPATFWPKQTYLDLLQQCHRAAFSLLDEASEQQLDEPGPEATRSYMPTIGAVFAMIGGHEMMHVGQIAVVRRMLGKPVVI